MALQRDGFLNATKEVLAKRAGQRCSNPDCPVATSGPHDADEKAINLGVAAHITAAAPGGPRYNPNMSAEDRSAITNGIWLCQTCAKLVDSDTARFPEELLIIWKRRHEEFVKTQMVAKVKPDHSICAPGLLNVSAAHRHWPANGRSCILDFRVSNQGASDLMINAVEFQVLESLQNMPLGHARYSELYDLDISELKEYSSSAECQVAQILKPGEADRFGVVLSAPTLQSFAGWRLVTLFKTNFGPIQGPEIEVWLPRPETISSFAAVTQHIASQAEKFIKAGRPVVAESEPGRSGGYKTTIIIDIFIFCYYGPQPLLAMLGTVSLSEFISRVSSAKEPL
jgi:hypothetical protein